MQRCRSLLQTHSKSSKVIVLLYQEMLRFMKNKTLRNYVNKQKLDEASFTSYFTNLEFGFNLTLFFEVHLGLGNELDPRKEKQTKRKKERKKERMIMFGFKSLFAQRCDAVGQKFTYR